MNTRIQVEHAVTEAFTGWDLVQAQIRLAAGELPSMTQDDIRGSGAAIECRLYAENPRRNFMPSPGLLKRLVLPAASTQLRIDCGVRQGDAVTPYYDPMIAKLISHGPDRETAIAVMRRALQALEIEGIQHNGAFLQALLDHPAFVAGEMDTGFVERERGAVLEAMEARAAQATS